MRLAVLISGLFLTTQSFAATVLKSSVTFLAHSSGPNIEGTDAKLSSLDLSASGGTAVVKLSEFTTGMSLRDKHMREKYFEIEKYPTAQLEFKLEGKDTFSGTLTVKTDKRPVKGIYHLNGGHIEAEFEFDLADFPSVGVPSWLGITVAGKVEVKVIADVQ